MFSEPTSRVCVHTGPARVAPKTCGYDEGLTCICLTSMVWAILKNPVEVSTSTNRITLVLPSVRQQLLPVNSQRGVGQPSCDSVALG